MSDNYESSPSPYAAPTTPSLEEDSGSVNPLIVQRLTGMKSWMYFIAILLSIVMCLSILFSVLGVFGYSISGAQLGIGPAMLIILSAGFCLLPAIRLFRICRSISLLQRTYSNSALDQTLADMQAFWKHFGMIAGSVSLIWLIRFGLFF